MRFGDAMKQIRAGMRLTRTGWRATRTVFLDTHLQRIRVSHPPDAERYTWNYYPDQADMLAEDWEIVAPEPVPGRG